MHRPFFVIGSLLGLLAVAAGAFGAHALESRLTPDRLQTWEIAARYQMYHALALLAAGWAAQQWQGAATAPAGSWWPVSPSSPERSTCWRPVDPAGSAPSRRWEA